MIDKSKLSEMIDKSISHRKAKLNVLVNMNNKTKQVIAKIAIKLISNIGNFLSILEEGNNEKKYNKIRIIETCL